MDEDVKKQILRQKIQYLDVGKKIRLATHGNKEVRSLLITDTNKEVVKAVISSPKISEIEVEQFAKMTNVSEEVLRYIGGRRNWCARYSIAFALINNLRTPINISLPLLKKLGKRQLDLLSKNRNIQEVVRREAQYLANKKKE
ncbi:MAG: hypothetical protein V1872_01910 [bacterium]